jgi:dystonin
LNELLEQGNVLIQRSPLESLGRQRIREGMQVLKARWADTQQRAAERKSKLQQCMEEVNNFHDALGRLIAWLTQTERILAQLQPVRRLVQPLLQQIDAHAALKRDIQAHREDILALDRLGTHLKYFSLRQDVVLIRNLLTSVHHRWERVISKSSERTRQLDVGNKVRERKN